MFNGTQVASLYGTLSLKIDDWDAGLAQADNKATSFGQNLTSIGQNISQVGGALTMAVAPLKAFFDASLSAAATQQVAMNRLQNAIQNVGGVTGVTVNQATDLASSIDKVTEFSDADITSAEALIATYKNISSSIFPDTLTAATDLATGMGTDLSSAAKMLAIALDNPTTGFSRLQRAGVTFSVSQQAAIKALAKTGDIAGADKIILTQLESKFKDAATAAGNTWAGKQAILNNALTDLQVKIGNIGMSLESQFLPIASEVINAISSWVDKNPQLTATILKVVGALTVLGPALIIVGGIISSIGVLISPTGLIIGGLVALVAAFATNFLHIQDIVTAFTHGIQSGFESLYFYASYYVGQIIDAFKPIVGQFLGRFIDAVNQLPGVLSAAWGAISGAITQFFWNVLAPVAITFVSRFVDAVSQLPAVLSAAWGVISGAISQFFWNVLEPIAVNFASRFVAAVTQLPGVLASAWGTVSGTISQFWQTKLAPFGDALLGNAILAIQQLPGVLGGALSIAQTALKTVFNTYLAKPIGTILAQIPTSTFVPLTIGIVGLAAAIATTQIITLIQNLAAAFSLTWLAAAPLAVAIALVAGAILLAYAAVPQFRQAIDDLGTTLHNAFTAASELYQMMQLIAGGNGQTVVNAILAQANTDTYQQNNAGDNTSTIKPQGTKPTAVTPTYGSGLIGPAVAPVGYTPPSITQILGSGLNQFTNLGSDPTPFQNEGTAYHDYPGTYKANTPYLVGARAGVEGFFPGSSSGGYAIPNADKLGGKTVNGGIHIHLPNVTNLDADSLDLITEHVMNALANA